LEISILFAKIIGLYCLIFSLSALLNFQRIPLLVQDFAKSEGLFYLAAIIALIIGIIVTILHPIITPDWRSLITLFGWLSFLTGILHLLVPELALHIFRIMTGYRLLFLSFNVAMLVSSLILLNEGFGIGIRFQ